MPLNQKPRMISLNQNSVNLSKFIYVFFVVLGFWSACKNAGTPKANSLNDSVSVTLRALNEAVAKNPDAPDNWYQRAVYFYQDKKYHEALSDIGRAINLDSTNPVYHYRIGTFLFSLNQSKKASLAFEKAVALKPDFSEAWQKLGELYLIVKEYGKSDSCWHKLYELDKTNPKAAYFRGIMYKDKGDTAKAIQSFQYAAELDEKYIEPALQLGILYASKNAMVCLGYFDAVLRQNPKCWEAFQARADFFRRQGKNAAAMKDLDMVLYYNPDNFMANYQAGVIFYSEGKNDKASEQFTRVIDKKPDYAFAFFSRALCYQRLGYRQQALNDLKACIAIDSSLSDASKLYKSLGGNN